MLCEDNNRTSIIRLRLLLQTFSQNLKRSNPNLIESVGSCSFVDLEASAFDFVTLLNN